MRPRLYASALALGVCATGCGDPDFGTDLDSEGPPEVTMVLVTSETRGEAATFCSNDADVKVHSAYCPESDTAGEREFVEVTDAEPVGWYTRVVFSELLDPGVETIVDGAGSLATTQPVTLNCGGNAVAYDGYYDPSGNDQTTPPGPSLVIETGEFVATGTDCTVALEATVTDKDDNAVAANLRGPYAFAIAVMSVVDTSPADMETDVDPATTIAVQFNAPVAPDTLAGNITLEGAADVPVTLAVSEDDQRQVLIEPTAGPLADDTEYTLTITGGITDTEGGAFEPAEPVTVTFTTGTLVAPDGGLDDAGTADAGDTDGGTADAAI